MLREPAEYLRRHTVSIMHVNRKLILFYDNRTLNNYEIIFVRQLVVHTSQLAH